MRRTRFWLGPTAQRWPLRSADPVPAAAQGDAAIAQASDLESVACGLTVASNQAASLRAAPVHAASEPVQVNLAARRSLDGARCVTEARQLARQYAILAEVHDADERIYEQVAADIVKSRL